MVRAFLKVFLLISLLHFANPFGASVAHFMSIRCTFADTFLKKAFDFYDEIVASSMISFYYHSKEEDDPQKILRVNGSYFIEDFDSLKPTRVVIHGFWNSHNSKINKALKQAYFSNHDVNLIIVNYSGISRDDCYKIVRRRVKMLGRRIAKFLDEILGDDESQWESLMLIGHSLGSHIAGGELSFNSMGKAFNNSSISVAGRSVSKGKVAAIFALDPAGPGFQKPTENRLRKGDADFIECIHTNGNLLGLMEPFCTIDFYPNFGFHQLGCKNVLKDLCSHSRAWKFFAESLTRNFTAYECEFMQEIYDKTPCNGTEILMGGEDFEAKRNASGIYFLETNAEEPFSKG